VSAVVRRLAGFSTWVGDAAAGLARLRAMLQRGRRIELIEQADGAFLAAEWSKGTAKPVGEPPLRLESDRFAGPISARMRMLLAQSRVEVLLAPSSFVFRRLDLPHAAGQFLEGVVRSQIDRLTPWSPSEAAFGWSAPVNASPERIAVTVAATARALVAPIAQAVLANQADSVRVSTRAEGDGTLVIPVLVRQSGGEEWTRKARSTLATVLALSGLVFFTSLAAWIVVGGQYDARYAELEARIAERRAALMNGQGSAAAQAIRELQARKRALPSAVMTLEALSKILPDDTHLTELRIEDRKVQIAGLAGDPPALIGLIEQSRRFTRATFFAPTVKSPNGGGENFHIEAQIEPSFSVTN
jgi:general secretion pathway protein L